MRARLSLLYFLQFGVWGCYLTCFGQLLGSLGLGSRIAWFYAAIGLVSLITPALTGHLADRIGSAKKLLAACHGCAAAMMGLMWVYASGSETVEFGGFFVRYLLFLAFYMPTMALANTATFSLLKQSGREPVDAFPRIRVWGTVGFVAAMWFVNCAWVQDGHFGLTLGDNPHRFQYTAMQLACTSLAGFACAAYCLTLPASRAEGGRRLTIGGLRSLMSQDMLRRFLLFAALCGVCLQISNGFVTPFITHFAALPDYAGNAIADNATMLFSLSQIAEAVFLLSVGRAIRRFGIRAVLTAGMAAWSLRFLLLAFGNPGSGMWMLAGSMIVYGVGFNFFTVAGHLYVEQLSPAGSKGLGQGAMMLMSNGIGATLGTLVAGAVVNHWCSWVTIGPMRYFMGNWTAPWLIFAAYALMLAALAHRRVKM